ncbi:MAG TPA: GNAT family N-acetyltransferase [Acidimicrobiales bacterium]|nr:GNAT family N-acetyltransferase [Acidimicrobiales bacterium]
MTPPKDRRLANNKLANSKSARPKSGTKPSDAKTVSTSTDLSVRTITSPEIDGWMRCMATGFLSHPAEGEGAFRLGDMDLDRTWGAFVGKVSVGTLRSFATPLTVPGPAEVTSAALTNVTVAPTHRRRGLLTRMITSDLRASAERGEVVGILIASEFPIYGRFGYGAAVDAATYTVVRESVRFLRRSVGHVELVDLPTLRQQAPPVYERFRVAQPGSIGRGERWWDRTLEQVEVPGATPAKGYQTIYRSPEGEVQGYLRYTASNEWDHMRPKGSLTVVEMVATTPDAYLGLWRYCCEVDLVTRIHAGDRSVHEPLAWFLEDGRAIRQDGRFDFLWVRVLDVAASLSARRYSTDGRLVIEVTDALGIANGRFALDGGPDGATCTKTTRSADLTLPVSALGSAYLGGMSLLTLGGAGKVDEHAVGALLRADTMFHSPVTPWCSTWF